MRSLFVDKPSNLTDAAYGTNGRQASQLLITEPIAQGQSQLLTHLSNWLFEISR
jgi:hypothetical protein